MENIIKEPRLTFTGVDESTDIESLIQISNINPFVEWGFLYSPKRSNRTIYPRYPSINWLSSALLALPEGIPISLHLCGNGVDEFILGGGFTGTLVKYMEKHRGRIQLNINMQKWPVKDSTFINKLEQAVRLHRGEVILPMNRNNKKLLDYPWSSNVSYLFDSSGGRGATPLEWKIPIPGKRCGYAGGLNPINLNTELGRIYNVAGRIPDWLDCESGVRDTEDRFDLSLVLQMIDTYKKFSENIHG